MQTRAVLLREPGRLEITKRDLMLKEDEVLVKTEYASICGTDKNIYLGNVSQQHFNMDTSAKTDLLFYSREVPTLPFWIGHEGGGTVMDVGSRVREFKVGDKVMSFGWYGTYADYFVAPVSGLEKVPQGLKDTRIAALGEPIGCAMFSVLTCGVNLGDIAVVLGTGFAGLIMIQGLKQRGAHKVIAVDKSKERLYLAKQLGADVTLHVGTDDIVKQVLAETAESGADLVVEMAGSQETINAATSILKHNGILVLYSYITEPVTLNIGRWHDDAFDIRTTCLVHHTVQERQVWTPRALRPVLLGQIAVNPLITHIFALDQVESAFQELITNPKAVKVMLKP